MIRKLTGFLFLLLLPVAGVAATPVLQTAVPGQIHTAAMPASVTGAGGQLSAWTVSTPDGPLTVLLQPAASFQAQAAGKVAAIRAGRTQVYRGRVAGKPDSWVRMTRIDGAWVGAIEVGGKLWLMDPARQHPQLAKSLGVDAGGTLVFAMSDISGLDHVDHAGREVPMLPPGATLASPGSGSARSADTTTGTQYYLGVSLVLDTEFQNHHGAQAESIAVAVLNIVDGFYQAQVNTQVYLYALQKLPAGNAGVTSTSANTLLDQFSVYVKSGGVPFNGLAHLLSGKNFNGSTVGLAFVGVAQPGYVTTVCNPGYVFRDGTVAGGTGVDQLTFSTAAGGAILAHEMGHNQGASHDCDGNSCPANGYIMASGLNFGNLPSEFSGCSINAFLAYRNFHQPACLDNPPDIIFQDSFD